MTESVKRLLRPAYRGGIRLYKKIKNSFLNSIDTPVVVLLYHRVASTDSDPQLLAVSPENFRIHLKMLKDLFPVLSMNDNWDNVAEPSVVITFDDGYADNYLNALPILEEFGIPAVFFISTGLIGSKRGFWWDELERIILLQNRVPERLELTVNGFCAEWPVVTAEDRHSIYQSIHKMLYSMDSEHREQVLTQLGDWGDASFPDMAHGRPMTVSEVKMLAKSSLATIGSHGTTHSRLYLLNQQKQKEEIFQSKTYLERLTGRRVRFFSYPFGTSKDYDKSTIYFLEEAGYEKAMSNFPGQWHRWTNPMQIPRQIVRDWNGNEFIERLGRFWLE